MFGDENSVCPLNVIYESTTVVAKAEGTAGLLPNNNSKIRNFRDNWLLQTAVGTAMVDTYYQISPTLANLLIEHTVALTFITKLKRSGAWAMDNWLYITILLMGMFVIIKKRGLVTRQFKRILPLFLVMGGAFTWAAGQIMIKTLGGRVGGFTLITWVAVFGTPQLFLSSWLFEDGQMVAIASAGWIAWGTVLYMGLAMTALGYAIWYHLLAKYEVTQVVPFLLLVPVMVIASSMVILGETLSLTEAVGSAIVIGGVAVIIIRKPAHPG